MRLVSPMIKQYKLYPDIKYNNIDPRISTMTMFILFESSIGYALFKLKNFDEANTNQKNVQSQMADFETFSTIAQLASFYPFESSNVALSIINTTITGKAPQELIDFLSESLPIQKKSKFKLGVSDNKLAGSINEALKITTTTSKVVNELIRGFRTHILQFLKNQQFENVDLEQSRLGLGHTFSRNKIAQDVNRQDKPIIQSISLLQLLDKDINTFAMRIRQWYSWHYPELARLVTDNIKYVQLVKLIGNRDSTQAGAEAIQQICEDGEIAEKVVDSCLNSMGQQISDLDIQSLSELCDRTLRMIEFRKQMQEYLKNRMEIVSPNLTTLIGQNVAAKLIAHSGSLSTLAKYPASTIQILGAEKALFRALKQKTKTPKYGLLFNTSFIGRAMGKNKGKISRYLANKCAMAARLDHFLINPTNKFGQKLRDQVENKLTNLGKQEDTQLEKNEEMMDEILEELKEENLYFDSEDKYKKSLKKQKKSKKKKVQQEQQVAEAQAQVEVPTKKQKKIKKH